MIEVVEYRSEQEMKRGYARLDYKFQHHPNAVYDNGIDLRRKRPLVASTPQYGPWISIIHRIIKTACRLDNVKRDDLLSASRKQHLVRTRRKVTYVAKQYFDRNFHEIGLRLCRDHTTVVQTFRKTKALLAGGDKALLADVEALTRAVGEEQG